MRQNDGRKTGSPQIPEHDTEKEVLAENISERLIFEPREIQQAVLSLMGEVDPELVKKLEKRFYF